VFIVAFGGRKSSC